MTDLTTNGHPFSTGSHRCLNCGKHEANCEWAEPCPLIAE